VEALAADRQAREAALSDGAEHWCAECGQFCGAQHKHDAVAAPANRPAAITKQLKEKIASALARACSPEDDPGDAVSLSVEDGMISATVVSRAFRGESPRMRQTRIWHYLNDALEPAERALVEIVVGQTPEEREDRVEVETRESPKQAHIPPSDDPRWETWTRPLREQLESAPDGTTWAEIRKWSRDQNMSTTLLDNLLAWLSLRELAGTDGGSPSKWYAPPTERVAEPAIPQTTPTDEEEDE
jgi:hypothetical protein